LRGLGLLGLCHVAVPLGLDLFAAGLVDADLLAVGQQLDADAVALPVAAL
jgi:hypothetical protein